MKTIVILFYLPISLEQLQDSSGTLKVILGIAGVGLLTHLSLKHRYYTLFTYYQYNIFIYIIIYQYYILFIISNKKEVMFLSMFVSLAQRSRGV